MLSKMRCLLVAFFLLAAVGPAAAAPIRAGALPHDNRLTLIQNEIGQQLQELVTGDAKIEIEPQETFGTRALSLLLNTLRLMREEGTNFVNDFAAVPQLKTWFDQQINSPSLAIQWEGIGHALLFVLGGAFLAGWLADLLFISLRRRIYQKEFKNVAAKMKGVFLWFFLSLIPLIVVVGTALAAVDAVNPSKLAAFLVMTIIYAVAILRLIRVISRFFLSPRVPSLRLLPVSTAQAVYAQKWIRAYAYVTVVGYFFAEIARVLKAPEAAISGFQSLIALVIVGMTIAIISQKRSAVSTLIRGDLSAARADQSLLDSLRLWLARTWHILAIGYLVIGYLVTRFSDKDGFMLMQKGTIGTLLALFAMRFLFYMTAKIAYKKRDGEAVSGIYRPVLRFLSRIAIALLGVAGIGASWGVDIQELLASAWGQRIMGSAFSIVSTILILVFVYEVLHSHIERRLNPRDSEGNILEPTARAKTLLPLLRYTAIGILSLIGGFVVLSELGINTGPLLAGAGVLGVAIGFGSQTLVKDFLTGLFIILEESISIGDIVRIGDNSGTVESMTVRTVRLRDLQGSLHILPFSEITRIVNSSKGFGQAMMTIGVAYNSDLKRVMEIMTEVGAALAQEEEYKNNILEPIEIFGVDELGDSAITVRGRIKTAPGKQWAVRRAYLLRIKERFDAEGIEIPFPQRVVYHHTVADVPVAKNEQKAEEIEKLIAKTPDVD